MFHVYILRCGDGSYYVGSTRDLESRVRAHQDGTACLFTKRRPPVELVYRELQVDLVSAIRRERQVKRWSREKKAALIVGDVDGLRALSRSRD